MRLTWASNAALPGNKPLALPRPRGEGSSVKTPRIGLAKVGAEFLREPVVDQLDETVHGAGIQNIAGRRSVFFRNAPCSSPK